MIRFLLIIFISLLISRENISSLDLFKFENNFYLANSYHLFSGGLTDYYPGGSIKLEGFAIIFPFIFSI